MIALLRTLSASHRRERGAVALEFTAVLGMLVLAILFFIDIVVLLGNATIMQGTLNRLALQVSAQGCVSRGALDGVERIGGIGINEIALEARTPASASFTFDRDAAQSGADATCDAGVQPSGRYIWIHLRYEQNLLVLGRPVVDRTALAVSNSLDEEMRP